MGGQLKAVVDRAAKDIGDGQQHPPRGVLHEVSDGNLDQEDCQDDPKGQRLGAEERLDLQVTFGELNE